MSSGKKMLSGRKMAPFGGSVSLEKMKADFGYMNGDMVKKFLMKNPAVLEQFLIEEIPTEKLKEILDRKIEKDAGTKALSWCTSPKVISIVDKRYKGDNIQLIVDKYLNEFSKLTCPFTLLRQAVQTVANGNVH
ncbi:hypothetical protein SNE40_019085 [Patella caerulea]|uniref:Uncharacterized protein n=1 Tax=Patella caerulea TaxID=87958 RepID=A0AAN8PHT1_PATCE